MCDSKKCSKCGEVKPLTDFGKRKDSKDGRRCQCKSCIAVANKAYHEANKERIAEISKVWREANKERIYAVNKVWREANIGTIMERSRAREQDLIESIPEGQEDEVNRIWSECPEGYQVDHIYPFSKGGTTSVDNLCYLPGTVNLSKHAKLPEGRILHEMLLKHAIIPAVSIHCYSKGVRRKH
tara:strand:+ start:123 stop:671 length:549 start_codon:yes stop_codon:yes gene_type:complete